MTHEEMHRIDRIAWLRAAVLGANDGIVSTASLLVGVAAAGADEATLFLTGAASTVAGAMSMAAGEYVSVKSQADSEAADLQIEREELEQDPEHELLELQSIYQGRGLDEALARQVAVQLTENDALLAHARDELGFTETGRARPLTAAASSAAAFSIGAALPVASVMLAPHAMAVVVVLVTSLFSLGALGVTSATLGGAHWLRPALRVVVWGALAMAATFAVGRLFGVNVN